MILKLPATRFPVFFLELFFLLSLTFVTPTTFAAFVPATEPALSQKVLNPGNDEAFLYVLNTMSNKDIEKLTGKKLTIKEKAGLFILRRKAIKNGRLHAQNMADWEDKCFSMYLKNGDVIEVKLIQISTSEIKYKRCNKPDDPEIIIAKTDVFTIKDSNGEAIYSSKDESWKNGNVAADGVTDKLALASGITGIAAVTLGLLIWPVGLAAAIAAGVMGIIALNRFKKNPKLRGEGWAITGIVAGGLWILFALLVLIAYASGW